MLANFRDAFGEHYFLFNSCKFTAEAVYQNEQEVSFIKYSSSVRKSAQERMCLSGGQDVLCVSSNLDKTSPEVRVFGDGGEQGEIAGDLQGRDSIQSRKLSQRLSRKLSRKLS